MNQTSPITPEVKSILLYLQKLVIEKKINVYQSLDIEVQHQCQTGCPNKQACPGGKYWQKIGTIHVNPQKGIPINIHQSIQVTVNIDNTIKRTPKTATPFIITDKQILIVTPSSVEVLPSDTQCSQQNTRFRFNLSACDDQKDLVTLLLTLFNTKAVVDNKYYTKTITLPTEVAGH